MRNHSYVNISFGNIDVTAGTDGTWVGSHLPWSTFPSLDYDHIYERTVATCELNRWTLNGSQVVRPNSAQEFGWISDALSDSDGNVSATLTREFASGHSLAGVTFTFDSLTNEFPVEGTLSFTDDLEDTDSVTFNPTEVVTPVSLVKEGVVSVTASFTKMLPYRRPRVLTTIWGIGNSYSNDDLVNVSESVDVDPMSRRLPSEKVSFTILDYEHKYDPDNPNGVYSTINRGAPITIAYGYELDDGSIEWLASDTYSLDNKPTFKNSQVTFTGIGMLAMMTNIYYKGVLGTTSFYDLAEDVLQDAGLTPTPSGDDPWDIDDSLKTMYTTAPMPIQTHAACLQMIAHACNCRLYTDENNIIHIKPFGVTPVGVFSGTFSDDGHTWYSSWQNVDYGVESEDVVATLELNRWVLGTPQNIAGNATITNGYVSDQMSGSDGAMTATWTKYFDVSHDVPKVVITFDEVLGEYPDTILVKYYEADGTLIDTLTDHPNSVTYTVESEVEDCSYFTVEVTDTKIPYRRSRVSRVAYFETDFSLTRDSMKQNTPVTSKLERLKNVTVAVYTSTPSSQPIEYQNEVDIESMSTTSQVSYRTTKLYEGYTTETSLHVGFQLATNVQITVSGGTLVSSNIYARAADLTLSSGTKYVLIQGVSLNETSEVFTYAFGTSGEDDIEENVLITNKAMADAHAAHVGEYLTLRNTYDAEYRGNPELEAGDIISTETMYDNIVYGIILVDTMSFNGSLSGKLKVKGLV